MSAAADYIVTISVLLMWAKVKHVYLMDPLLELLVNCRVFLQMHHGCDAEWTAVQACMTHSESRAQHQV